MTKYIFTLLAIFLAGCASNKEALSSNANVFNLNGENISVTDGMLLELCEK